jgi:hypothetical protein
MGEIVTPKKVNPELGSYLVGLNFVSVISGGSNCNLTSYFGVIVHVSVLSLIVT